MSTQIEILLVEDNPRDAEMTLRALKKHNLTNSIVHLKDGQEALDFLFGTGSDEARDIPDTLRVILLDLKLPKVDGLEVLRQIKAHEAMKATPVVVLTSSQEERDIVESYKLGVNSYIVKPVDFENFCTSVSQLGLYWLLLNQPPVS